MNKKTLKTIAFSLGMAALMLQAVPADAQVINRGLLQNPYKEQGNQNSLMRRQGTRSGSGYSVATEQFGNGTDGLYNIGTEQFGNEGPLGSGLFIMAAAGAAYAFKKRNKTSENK